MTTIYDVARLAGVSPATVSRVFNGASVSEAKSAAVRQAAARLGFVPNANAQRLRTGSSHLIAVLVPDIENPFFTSLTRGVQDVVRAAGYGVLLANTDDDQEQEDQVLATAVADRLAGLVVVPSRVGAGLTQALERGVPVVCVDRDAPGQDVDTVVSDNVGHAREATADLFARGYTRPGCLSGPEGVMTADRRVDGWRAAWRDAGHEPPEELVRRVAFTADGGIVGMQSLLADGAAPDSVLAANNRIAMGALEVLHSRGLAPKEFGVASLGALPFSLYVPDGVLERPMPSRPLGVRGAELLLERIGGYTGPPRHEVLTGADEDERADHPPAGGTRVQ